jgi:hypothetical protein
MVRGESKFDNADWIRRNYKCEMSPLGVEVANLLGDVYGGIYHLDFCPLGKVNWSDPFFIRFLLGRGESTFDGGEMTALVVLSHDRMIRIEINPCNFRYLELLFHKRKSRDGDISQRMPTIEDHIALIRKYSDRITDESKPGG